MSTVSKKLGAAVLSLAFIFAATSQASAQHWRRGRDRDLSTGQKTAIIGGGAAAGAVLGALMGGKKGALIGGAIGGGAGTGIVVLKDRNNDDDRFRGRFDRRDWRDSRYYANSRYYRVNDRFVGDRFDRNRWDRDRRWRR